MKYLAPALLLVLLIASMRADINENAPFALGLIKKQPRPTATPLPMEPVKLADLTEDYEKDFSHFTKCQAYLNARKRPPYNPENPAELVHFTDAEKRNQSAAGETMLKEIASAIKDGKKEYSVPAGTYRIKQPVRINGARDFTLKFDHAERDRKNTSPNSFLASKRLTSNRASGPDAHFSCLSCSRWF